MSNLNIPEEFQKYSEFIDELDTQFTKIFNMDIATFDGQDVMSLLNILSKTVSELRDAVEDLKNVPDSDRIALYGVVLTAIIEKSVLSSSKLTEEQKDQVRKAFATGGLVQNLLEAARKHYLKILNNMDVNKDKKVTKQEYENYIFKKNKKFCGCVGDVANLRSAKCSANCCFPFLSGGDDIIDLEESEEETEVIVEEETPKKN